LAKFLAAIFANSYVPVFVPPVLVLMSQDNRETLVSYLSLGDNKGYPAKLTLFDPITDWPILCMLFLLLSLFKKGLSWVNALLNWDRLLELGLFCYTAVSIIAGSSSGSSVILIGDEKNFEAYFCCC
jgi:hypothetical protein